MQSCCRFPGGLKEVRVKKEFYTDPTRILFRAVSGMLPKNKLRQVLKSALSPVSSNKKASAKHSKGICDAVGQSISSKVGSRKSLMNGRRHSKSQYRSPSRQPSQNYDPWELKYCLQVRTKKLRIYPDADHPFKGDPRLVEMIPQQKNVRSKEPLFSLPEGFEPMNRDAYRKRFSHMLPKQVSETLRTSPPASKVLPSKE